MAQLCSLLLILASIGLFSNPSMAHLTGILSQSIEDSELLTAVITNTGPQHIAVLKHNTILDTSHLSMPCRIAENGKPLRMGGSHVMYSGIGKSDLLNLAPGSNFTRHLNMTDYIGHGLADGAQSSRTITASLPSMLQGRESQDGSYQIHPDALGDTSGPQARMGDPSKANLIDIAVQSKALQITVLQDNSQSHNLEKRIVLPPPFNGIKLNKDRFGKCTDAQATNFTSFILGASYLAVAAKNAASDFHNIPFNYFMPATLEAASIVGNAMEGVVKAQLGQGPPVSASCNDDEGLCRPPTLRLGEALPYGYSVYTPGGRPGFIPKIVMCPNGLRLQNNYRPCSAQPGAILTGSYIFLQNLMLITEVSGVVASLWGRPQRSARAINRDVVAGKNTTTDAAALGMLGSWSWDVGLGGNPWNGSPCVENFLHGRLDTSVNLG